MTISWAEIADSDEGLDLGVTDWKVITQQHLDHFARATGDTQFIHLDPERAAREGPFGGAIAQGYLLLSMMPVLLAQRIELPPKAIVINYGLERLRFAAPVRVGERFRGRFFLTSRNRIGPSKTILKVRAAIEVENVGRPAVAADSLIALVEFRVEREPVAGRRQPGKRQ